MPVTLVGGMDPLDQVKLIPAPGRSIQLLGTTYISSESLQRKKRIDCRPRIVIPRGASGMAFRLVDVGDLGGTTSKVHSANRPGHATGESFLSPSGPSHAFYWAGAKMRDIGTLAPHVYS